MGVLNDKDGFFSQPKYSKIKEQKQNLRAASSTGIWKEECSTGLYCAVVISLNRYYISQLYLHIN